MLRRLRESGFLRHSGGTLWDFLVPGTLGGILNGSPNGTLGGTLNGTLGGTLPSPTTMAKRSTFRSVVLCRDYECAVQCVMQTCYCMGEMGNGFIS